jgi:hypothetical protein
LRLVSAVLLTASLDAQQTLEVTAGNTSTPVISIGVTNGVSTTFTWTKTSDVNTIVTTVFPLSTPAATTSSQTLTISGIATAGQQATINVAAQSVAGSCNAVSSANLIISIVATPTYTVSFGTTTQNVCQNAAAANITDITLTGPGGSTINSFTYYIDSHNPGTQDADELTQTVLVGAPSPVTTGIINMTTNGFSTATAGSQVIRVTSVNGTSGATTLSSAVTTNNVQTITINALPVLGNFAF